MSLIDWKELAKSEKRGELSQIGKSTNPINTGDSPRSPPFPILQNRVNRPNAKGFPKFPMFPTKNTKCRGVPNEENLKEAFEERAAIMEFDGGLNRQEAERLAFEVVYKKHSGKMPIQ